MKTWKVALLAVATVLGIAGPAAAQGTAPAQGPAERGAARAGEFIDDAVLTGRIKAALANAKGVRVLDVQVETRQGVVQLSGFVDTVAEKEAALVAARQVSGVRELKDAIEVRPRH
jgi:hyperosmotically inducible protein